MKTRKTIPLSGFQRITNDHSKYKKTKHGLGNLYFQTHKIVSNTATRLPSIAASQTEKYSIESKKTHFLLKIGKKVHFY